MLTLATQTDTEMEEEINNFLVRKKETDTDAIFIAIDECLGVVATHLEPVVFEKIFLVNLWKTLLLVRRSIVIVIED